MLYELSSVQTKASLISVLSKFETLLLSFGINCIIILKFKNKGGNLVKQEIKNRLMEMSDETYRKFHSSLCPETQNILGVRVPILKNYAKELYKEYGINIIDEIDDQYYEEILLKGLLISKSKSVNVVQTRLRNFIPSIDNWAICDITCGSLKLVKKYKEEFLGFIEKYAKSNKEFEVRFALVMLLDYYVDEEHIDKILQISSEISHEGYYAKMANAWLLSVCLVKFYAKTKKFMKKNNFDDFTYNKAIQKALESCRIEENKKEELRKMRKN